MINFITKIRENDDDNFIGKKFIAYILFSFFITLILASTASIFLSYDAIDDIKNAQDLPSTLRDERMFAIKMHLMLEDITGIFLSLAIAFAIVALKGRRVLIDPYLALNKSRKEITTAKEKTDKIAQLPLNNPHPLIQVGAEGIIEFANPAAYEHFSGLDEDGVEHPALFGLHEYLDEMAKKRKIEKESNSFVREIIYGDKIYHQTITPINVGGHPALVIYCYDVTDIREVQNKARLLEAVIVNARDAVIITNADIKDPKILYVNDAVTRISGYEPHELIGKTPRILQGGSTDKAKLKELKEALEKGRPFKGELQNFTKDGHAYWLDISIVPVRNEAGIITHFAAIERDITQRKVFEKQLQVTKEAAEVASRAKGDFLANMSHELRTPMNGIIGLSELLMEMDMSEEQTELAEAVNSSSRNLLILLNDILDLSKIEAGELTLESIPFDTRRAVYQTIDLLRPIASRKGVVLETAINPIVPERVVGDPARLQQIMNNLISNAIKFTEVGYVRIDVTSARDKAGDQELRIRVEDTGIGIPDDKREYVFQKFTQADVSTARKYGGTGLGLAITKELVEMMGGDISLDSALGKGTTFYVTIPLEIAKQAEDTDIAKTAEKPIDINARLLVVDDHPVNLLFMRKVLKKLGFSHVDEAGSGREAVEMAETKSYDLIFMDCQMPEIDGFEAATLIREKEELIGDIRIIAVTADAMKGAREKCLDSGMNDYISKPVDIEKLTNILGEWLPGHTSQERHETRPSAVKELINDLNTHSSKSDTTPLVIDWDRLRLFTDGDQEEEKKLIEMFVTYAKESLDVLKENCKDGEDHTWEKAAHKLKGSAANLGAQKLSECCYEAEMAFTQSRITKQKILGNVMAAYEQVIHALSAEQADAA